MDTLYGKAFNFITDTYIWWKGLQPINTSMIIENLYAIKTGTVNFYVYKRDGTVIALDTGFCIRIIKRELNLMEIYPDIVSAVFLSHTDFDHSGGISVFTNASIYLSQDEEQLIKRTGADTMAHSRARKYGFVYNKKIKRPYHLLKNNEEVSIGAIKVRAIETPGHTPGSMSYLIDEAILFVGDAFRVINGMVQPLGEFYNMDQEEHLRSIRKLAKLQGVKLVLTGHRGYLDNFDTAAAQWR
ncbi:MAG: MBL fold metallo-hydrolase [Oscillospiraceae bacterium]|nr:MBL fold metallo-hydrolase [Oscillospiraceae bacterium]